MTTACMYLRLSREDGDSMESNSISNQRQIIQTYAKVNGLKIAYEYVDDGYSGSNFERPDFKKMIQDLEEGKFSTMGQLDGFAGGVGPGAGNHRNAPGDLVDHTADDFLVLFHVQGGGLPGGTDRNNAVGALVQMEFDQAVKRLPIQVATRVHGGYQRHKAA